MPDDPWSSNGPWIDPNTLIGALKGHYPPLDPADIPTTSNTKLPFDPTGDQNSTYDTLGKPWALWEAQHPGQNVPRGNPFQEHKPQYFPSWQFMGSNNKPLEEGAEYFANRGELPFINQANTSNPKSEKQIQTEIAEGPTGWRDTFRGTAATPTEQDIEQYKSIPQAKRNITEEVDLSPVRKYDPFIGSVPPLEEGDAYHFNRFNNEYSNRWGITPYNLDDFLALLKKDQQYRAKEGQTFTQIPSLISPYAADLAINPPEKGYLSADPRYLGAARDIGVDLLTPYMKPWQQVVSRAIAYTPDNPGFQDLAHKVYQHYFGNKNQKK